MKKIFLLGLSLSLVVMSCSKKTDAPSSSFVLDQNNLKGTISDGTVTLQSGKKYLLTGPLTVKAGATLKLEAGTIVEAQTDLGATTLYITIERGAKIDAQGTASSPITLTSTGTAAGSWGGLILVGKAPNNISTDAQSEITGVVYGGTEPTDNSGTIKYMIIRNSGSKINDTKEFNGLSMFSVGSGTTIQYVAVFNGNDDAFEWYGGTVNCSYLYASNNDDDNFDFDEGYVGTLTTLYSVNTNLNASADSRGIEGDGNPTNFVATPTTNPTISDVTLVGRGSATATSSGAQLEAIKLRRGTKATISNVYMKGYKTGLNVEHDETIAFANAGTLKVTNVTVADITTNVSGKATAGTAVTLPAGTFVVGSSVGAGSGESKPSWANWF